MINRVLKFLLIEDFKFLNYQYKSIYESMIEMEQCKAFQSALDDNDMAYNVAFALYQKAKTPKQKKLHLGKLEDLMKKAEEYLVKLNKNTRLT